MIRLGYIRNLTTLAVMFICSLLLMSGCGFKLRGSGYESLAGQTIFLHSKDPYGALERDIRTRFQGYSIVTDSSTTTENGIRITQIKSKQDTISVDANGRAVEFETIITVEATFYFKNSQQQQRYFSVQRDYRYDNDKSLAYDRELETINSEMITALSRRIVEQFLTQLLD